MAHNIKKQAHNDLLKRAPSRHAKKHILNDFSILMRIRIFYASILFVDVIKERHITLSSKSIMTFSKEHQTGTFQFDALSRAKVVLLLSFT